MTLTNVTLKQIIKYISGLKSQLYNVTITPVESQSVESTTVESQSVESTSVESQSVESTSVESTTVESQSVESTSVESQSVESTSRDIFDARHTSIPGGIFDITKKILEKVTHKHYIKNHVKCELVDLSGKYNKLASISRSDDDLHKTVLINTGTYKYKSIKHDRLLLSLHFAECIFREILYDTYGKIDIDVLDDCVDEYYTVCFSNLKSKYNYNG